MRTLIEAVHFYFTILPHVAASCVNSNQFAITIKILTNVLLRAKVVPIENSDVRGILTFPTTFIFGSVSINFCRPFGTEKFRLPETQR